MQLKDLRQEFLFDCQVRELSEKTINLYTKQTDYLVTFLESKCGVTEVEKFKPLHIKMFISSYQKEKKKPAYINDLLRTVKCMCAYAYREGYTQVLLTENVKNVKEPKVIMLISRLGSCKSFLNIVWAPVGSGKSYWAINELSKQVDNSCEILTVMLAFAEYERGMIVERTQTGKAIARANPSFKDGRPKKFSRTQVEHAMKLLEDGFSYRQVEEMTGISKSTLSRAKKDR